VSSSQAESNTKIKIFIPFYFLINASSHFETCLCCQHRALGMATCFVVSMGMIINSKTYDVDEGGLAVCSIAGGKRFIHSGLDSLVSIGLVWFGLVCLKEVEEKIASGCQKLNTHKKNFFTNW
jgi:hypothetical protein